MAQELANAIVSASHKMENENPRAFATLDIVTSVSEERWIYVEDPEFDQKHWPTSRSSRNPIHCLASALNRLAYSGFYPTTEQTERIQEFWGRPLGQSGRLFLILTGTIPPHARRPEN